jgi:hypothetical protein
MEMDPASYFSIIFVDTNLSNPPTETITLNYTWYGQNDFTIEGVWLDVNLALTVEDTDYSVPLTVFVSYMKTPESGV